MESPASANECAQSKLLLENILSGGTLEAGTTRICEVAGCTGAAVLRPSLNAEGSLIPGFANPDGTPRDDSCPVIQEWEEEVEALDVALLRAIRDKKDPNA